MGFEWAYRNADPPPWDIGRPQPVVARLAEEGAFAGSVIDLGCGTGENALFLASRGLEVTGLDAAPTAIARARQKAADRGIRASFVVADALALAALGRTFDAAFDSGLFHVFSDEERARFERGLRELLRPGGRYFMLCFSDLEPWGGGPRRVSQAEIRTTFATGWHVDSIVAERFATLDRTATPHAPRAWLASLTRLADAEPDAATMPEAASTHSVTAARQRRRPSRHGLGRRSSGGPGRPVVPIRACRRCASRSR